ncbi:transcription-silencing protein Clr2-domain-containing protein [Lophiotrema nucula]|uniref:Transcription-silencing protein Clr2-domain-containing protein n=1 Tax=Lophiotrema nucula TaxID=690887 RepID=A0A6A5ZPB9_9PLEO|nr:transcription-silencing protein Clr2-domain-containing protein [Lophiotrema nucula]
MATAVMTQFYPLFPHKSDGCDEILSKGLNIKNGPNASQLDQTPNAQGQADYYRVISKDEPKHIDWRKKLGGMLLRELGGKQHEDKWTQCILFDLPKGYRLYEHIKSKADGQQKAVKNHSGGGHDRQDAYLYGHPKGPKKRFRSPVEFFPHLLWLSTDETANYDNCSCKLCCPLSLEAEKAVVRADGKENSPVVKKENSPAVSLQPNPQVNRNPAVQIPTRNPSVSTTNGQSPSVKPTPTPNRIIPPPTLTPTSLPQPRSLDQQVDSQYNKFLCRTGEVVWFFREKNNAWGLGLVLQRWIPKDGSSTRAHKIQPLSHPFQHPEPEVIVADGKVKPWLAWSAPSCTYPYLQQNHHLPYEQVDWNALLSGRLGPGNAEVDASILAAKSIDATYSLFERVKTTPSNSGYEERHWNGLYFGAEKIWNGDIIRLRMLGDPIMIITDIVERVSTTASTPSSSVHIIGDVFTYALLPVTDPSNPPEPNQNGVSLRMREDMRWRNQFLIPATRSKAYWKLMKVQQRVDLPEIKGRWYETSIVFVESFQKAVKNGEGGNGIWMNTRGDATNLGPAAGTKQENRVEAFGDALPKNTQLIDGLEPPADLGNVTGQAPQGMQGMDLPSTDSGFALDDFMNLDSMDDGAMGFNDGFNFG